MIKRNRSIEPISLSRRKGRKIIEATPSLRVATSNESTPERALPISPKEKAQIKETRAR
jgi:hypothetical protein